jgi:hypothetical protein
MIRMMLLPAVMGLSACEPLNSGAGAGDGAQSGAPAPRGPYAVDIALSLTPASAARLAQRGERVRIEARYVLKPAEPAATGRLSPADVTQLAAEALSVPPASGLARASGEVLRGLVPEGGADAIHVLVTLSAGGGSGHRSGEGDLIVCGMYQGPLAMAQRAPLDLRCDIAG